MKAACYLRVSTTGQNEDTQLPDILAQCKRDGAILKDKHIYRDKVSGLKDIKDRKGLNELLSLTKEDIDIVYIWEISRLSRNPIYFDELILHFKKQGINICFLTPYPLYLFRLGTNEEDLTTSLVLAFVSKFALFEIKQKTQRQQRGKKEAIVTRNESYTFVAPYGYKKVNKKLVINDDHVSDIEGFTTEAEIIRSIFQFYIDGKSLRDVASILNEYKIPTSLSRKANKEEVLLHKTIVKTDKLLWGKRSINNMLQNTVYAGYKEVSITINGNVEKNIIEVPNIVSKETFLKAEQQRKDNITIANKSYKNEFLLRGLLKCGECGLPYLGTSNRKNIYKCSGRRTDRTNTYIGCKGSSIATEMIDTFVWSELKHTYEDIKRKESKEADIYKLHDDISKIESIIKLKNDNIDELNKQNTSLAQSLAFIPNTAREIVYKQLNDIDKNINIFNKQVDSLLLKKSNIEAQIQAIRNMDTDSIIIKDDSFQLRYDATRELLSEVILHSHGKFRLIQMVFKAGYTYNLLLRVTNQIKKHITFSNELFTFSKDEMNFSADGMVSNYNDFSFQSKKIFFSFDEIWEDLNKPLG